MINFHIKNLSIGVVIIAMLYFSNQKCTSDLIKYGVWIISGVVLISYSIHYLYYSIRDRIIRENKSIIDQSKAIQELNTQQMDFVKNQQNNIFLTKGGYDVGQGKSTMPTMTKSNQP